MKKSKSKYPDDYIYFIGVSVNNGEYVIGKQSKYNSSNCVGEKYGTREEAQNEINRRNLQKLQKENKKLNLELKRLYKKFH